MTFCLLCGAILVLHLSTSFATPQTITYTGYLVDIYCWNLDQHIGLDGANLELRPQSHLLHCIADEAPCRSGLLLLEKYNDGGQEKYRDKYYLDTRGNQLGYEYYDAEFTNGDRKITELATVTGNVTGSSGVIVVESLQFSNNDEDMLIFIVIGSVAAGVVVLAAAFYVYVQQKRLSAEDNGGGVSSGEAEKGKIAPL